MTEGLSVYSHLELTPPLQLKSLGTEGPRLVLIEKGRMFLNLSLKVAFWACHCISDRNVVIYSAIIKFYMSSDSAQILLLNCTAQYNREK